MTTDTLVKAVSITSLLNQRAAVVQWLHQALDLIAKAEELAKTAHIGFPRLVVDNQYSLRGSAVAMTGQFARRPDVNRSISHAIDSEAWQYLMSESGLRTFMDASAREQWNQQIKNGEIPALTRENVQATFGMLYESRADMFERGVIQCFRRLSWDYKTNQPCKFGKRIIVDSLFSYGTPNHYTTDELDDLMRVFHLLDGKPEADHRHGMYSLVSAGWRAGASEGENDYLRVKWFKKGTGHLLFKRLDLVDELNRILAKHYPDALPNERGIGR